MLRTSRHLFLRILLLLALFSEAAGASLYEELSIGGKSAQKIPKTEAMLETALEHCRAGETAEALRLLFRIESSTTHASSLPDHSDLRLALLYTALGLSESEKAQAAANRAMASPATTGLLARIIFAPKVALSPEASAMISKLREEVDATPTHPLRETLFLAHICDTVRAADELVAGDPIGHHSLLQACINRDKASLEKATAKLQSSLMGEALLQKWPRPGKAEAQRLQLAIDRLVQAEYAFLDHALAKNSAGLSFEGEAEKQTVNAVHKALSLAVLGGSPFAKADPGDTLQHTFPALRLRPLGPNWDSSSPVPYLFRDSWAELHFELCHSFVKSLSKSSDRVLLAKHLNDVTSIAHLAAKLRPGQRDEVLRSIADFNANVQRLNAEELAARRARAEAQRQRDEERRAAAEAAQRRRQEAENYAQHQQPQQTQEPAQNWRWCMRCSGTGTYSQYTTRQGPYGRSERVQEQVRCDRCWGSGKLR